MKRSNDDVERNANRFAAWSCLVFGLAVAAGALAGRFESMFMLAWRFIVADLAFGTAPCLAVAAWSFRRGHSGAEVKWAAVAAMLSSSSAILFASQTGFIAFIFVILVSCRYFRPKFVWGVFAAVVVASVLASIPHAAFGYMSYTPDERMLAGGTAASVGMSRPDYWKSMMLREWPACVLIYLVTAFISWRICVGGREMVARERAIQRRLADVERGLAIAASQYFAAGGELSALPPFGLPAARDVRPARQPDVNGWTMQQISACLAECKRRAAADPAFAALVERDPAAAVREASQPPHGAGAGKYK